MLFIKHGALTLDSCVGAPLLARTAKSPDKKVPYFATDLEYMTYSAAKIHEEQDKVADFAERHPDVFMENLLPTAFVSVAHAIHNSACAGSVDIKQLSLRELRVAFDANLRREKIDPPQPLLAYH